MAAAAAITAAQGGDPGTAAAVSAAIPAAGKVIGEAAPAVKRLAERQVQWFMQPGTKMLKYEADPHASFCSILRYNRAKKLLEPHLGRVTPETIMAIQRDHLSQPDSICRHVNPADPEADRVKTLFGSILNLTKGEAYISGSTPCTTEYRVFRLNG